jgi:hypothetical protein
MAGDKKGKGKAIGTGAPEARFFRSARHGQLTSLNP